jgi:hypothetical protein
MPGAALIDVLLADSLVTTEDELSPSASAADSTTTSGISAGTTSTEANDTTIADSAVAAASLAVTSTPPAETDSTENNGSEFLTTPPPTLPVIDVEFKQHTGDDYPGPTIGTWSQPPGHGDGGMTEGPKNTWPRWASAWVRIWGPSPVCNSNNNNGGYESGALAATLVAPAGRWAVEVTVFASVDASGATSFGSPGGNATVSAEGFAPRSTPQANYQNSWSYIDCVGRIVVDVGASGREEIVRVNPTLSGTGSVGGQVQFDTYIDVNSPTPITGSSVAWFTCSVHSELPQT